MSETKKKAAIVFTGGTIGSAAKDGVISVNGGAKRALLSKASARTGKIYDFDQYEPYTVLSENVSGKEITLLVECMSQILKKDYKGVVVTHGTDTLQYTASLLSYLLGANTPPVVLVSSDYPLDDERANGMDNFIAATEFIENGCGKGVFVAYKNPGENVKIHRGGRLLPAVAYSGAIYSVRNSFYGEYIDGKFIKNEKYVAIPDEITPIGEVKLSEYANGILWIKPYAGLFYPPLSASVKAVLHDSFHSGTVRTDGTAVARFAAELKEKNIPLYLTGATGKGAHYESTRKYGELGFKILPEISPVAAYCKLWLALTTGKKEDFLFASLGEDILPE